MENKTYYDWLFEETEEEKLIMAEIDAENEAFDKSPEYLAHKERFDALWAKLKKARNSRRKEAKKHRPKRKPVKPNNDFDLEAFRKKNAEEHEKKVQALPDNIKNLILSYRSLTDEEKKKFTQMSWYDSPKNEELDKYTNPKTIGDDIKQLQEILVQTVIDFINERNLTDIDAVCFSADGLSTSAKYGEWTCSTDSSISIEGLEEEIGQNGDRFTVRRLIGHNLI